MGCLRKVVGGIVVLGVIVAAAYAGWRWGPAVFPRAERWLEGRAEEVTPGTEEPSPEVADRVMARVEAFVESARTGDEFRLDDLEVTSVLRYASPGLLPAGIDEPTVWMEDGRLRLGARVTPSSFPDFPELEGILGILPDTVPLEVEASLLPFDDQAAAVLVQKIEAAGIPLPRRSYPTILTALGRRDRRGLPPEAVAVPLPEGLRSVYIAGDSLVLVVNR